jgi:hypothetical protein
MLISKRISLDESINLFYWDHYFVCDVCETNRVGMYSPQICQGCKELGFTPLNKPPIVTRVKGTNEQKI